MFYLPESRHGERGGITRVPVLDLEGNPSTFFPFMEVGRGSSANTNTMLNTVATSVENRTLPFFHELDIHLQDDSNSSIMKQVMSHDETMSLFPEIKLDEEDAKTVSLPEITAFDAVSFSEQGIRSEGSKNHLQFAAGSMYEQALQPQLPNAGPVYQEAQHEMMQADYVDRRGEDVFSAQVQSQVCPLQRTQIRRGGSLPVSSLSTGAGRGSFVPHSPLLHWCLRQNLMSSSPTPLDEEDGLSPSPSRKVETVGGKKMFSSQNGRPSCSPISSNLNGTDEYKMENPGNPAAVREYITNESRTMCIPMKHDNFKSPSSLLDSTQVGQNLNMIPSSLEIKSFQDQLLSPVLVASIQPSYLELMKGLTGFISNNSTRSADHLAADYVRSHGYDLSNLQNTSVLPFMGSMQSMTIEQTDGSSSVIYTIPSSFSVERTPMEDATRSTLTLREDLMASNASATKSQSHTDMMMEDLNVRAGIMSHGNLFDISGTARPSSTSKDTIETEVSTADPSSILRNCGKGKRWIYKQARLPKKRPLTADAWTAGDPMIETTRRRRAKSEEEIEEIFQIKSRLDISACVPDTETEKVHSVTSPTLSHSLIEKGQTSCACPDLLCGGNSIPLSANDYLEKTTDSVSPTSMCTES